MFWDPFDEIERIHEEMGRFFKPRGKELVKFSGFRTPKCNMHETEKSVVASFELPGVEKKDIELNVTDDRIEVKVNHKAEKEEKKKGMYRYEASSHSFYRSIPLPVDVKSEEAEAEYKNGVLRVEIPKVKQIEAKKHKRIEIK